MQWEMIIPKEEKKLEAAAHCGFFLTPSEVDCPSLLYNDNIIRLSKKLFSGKAAEYD